MNQEQDAPKRPRSVNGSIDSKVLVPLLAGTKERIDAVRQERETRAAFIRTAIDAELKRRERLAS